MRARAILEIVPKSKEQQGIAIYGISCSLIRQEEWYVMLIAIYRYDELHPSEQADRIVAREVAQVIKGQKNQWTTWLS